MFFLTIILIFCVLKVLSQTLGGAYSMILDLLYRVMNNFSIVVEQIVSKTFGLAWSDNQSFFDSAGTYGYNNYSGMFHNLYSAIEAVAIALALFLLIYGFIVENLDFHIQDGWNIVIRFLIKMAIIVPVIKIWPKILGTIAKVITTFNSQIASTFKVGGQTGLLMEMMKLPTTAQAPINYWIITTTGGIPNWMIDLDSALEPPSLLALVNVVESNAQTIQLYIGMIISYLLNIVCICAVIVMIFSLLKKFFKFIIDFSLPYIEFAVLACFVPIGMAMYASRSTQSIGQSFFRKLFSVGLLNAIRIIGLKIILIFVYNIIHLDTLLANVFGAAAGGGGVPGAAHGAPFTILSNSFGIPEGVMVAFATLITTTLVVHLAEAWFNKAEQISSAVAGH